MHWTTVLLPYFWLLHWKRIDSRACRRGSYRCGTIHWLPGKQHAKECVKWRIILKHTWWLMLNLEPRGGHFLCRVVRDARLYMVIFEKFSVLFPRDGYLFSTKFLYFSARWVSILKTISVWISVFVEQDGTDLQEIFCVYYSTKFLHFTHKISVYFYEIEISFQDSPPPISQISGHFIIPLNPKV